MPRPRKILVRPEETPYYHCVSRCVRRSYLCGKDAATGRSYEHRKQWLVERIHLLASVFAIDICAYAVMSNHYHLVLRVGSSRDWSDEEVINRWLVLFKGTLLTRAYAEKKPLSASEMETVSSTAAVWRIRLQDLSWFMKCLNEPIARKANREDDCTGHFWESRFKSQALRSERALLACMAYVDLNPVRAGVADSLDRSAHTSIQARIRPAIAASIKRKTERRLDYSKSLLKPKRIAPFKDEKNSSVRDQIAFSLNDYVELLCWTQRKYRSPEHVLPLASSPRLLREMQFGNEEWRRCCMNFEQFYRKRFGRVA